MRMRSNDCLYEYEDKVSKLAYKYKNLILSRIYTYLEFRYGSYSRMDQDHREACNILQNKFVGK